MFEKNLLELEQMTNERGRITVIVPTSTSPMWMFQLMVLSLYFRTTWADVSKVIFVLNGPAEHHTQKHKWLCWLRATGLMPITIITVDPQVGHHQALDCAIPWATTEFVASFHDDILIEDSNWSTSVLTTFGQHPRLGMLLTGWCGFDGQTPWQGQTCLHKRHPATDFVVWRKDAFTASGALWRGYHAVFSEQCVVSRDVGYWAEQNLLAAKWEVRTFATTFHKHFLAGSWAAEARLEQTLVEFAPTVNALHTQIANCRHDLRYTLPWERPATVTYDDMVVWHNAKEMHIHQNFYEFREWLRLLQHIKPETLLEIGTYKWGTAQMVLEAVPSIKRLVTVDIVDRLAERPDILEQYAGRLDFLQGDTKNASTWDRIAKAFEGPVDVAFVDGDHDYTATMVDVEHTKKLMKYGGIIGIHDVGPSCGNIGSVVAFKELSQKLPNRTHMIDCSAEKGPWDNYGIGVYWCV